MQKVIRDVKNLNVAKKLAFAAFLGCVTKKEKDMSITTFMLTLRLQVISLCRNG